MTFMRSTKRYLSILLTALFMLTSMASLQAQAAICLLYTSPSPRD